MSTPTMLDRLKTAKAEVAALREQRGATDPILIVAGTAISLILLVGGSFAIAGFDPRESRDADEAKRIGEAQLAYLGARP